MRNAGPGSCKDEALPPPVTIVPLRSRGVLCIFPGQSSVCELDVGNRYAGNTTLCGLPLLRMRMFEWRGPRERSRMQPEERQGRPTAVRCKSPSYWRQDRRGSVRNVPLYIYFDLVLQLYSLVVFYHRSFIGPRVATYVPSDSKRAVRKCCLLNVICSTQCIPRWRYDGACFVGLSLAAHSRVRQWSRQSRTNPHLHSFTHTGTAPSHTHMHGRVAAKGPIGQLESCLHSRLVVAQL